MQVLGRIPVFVAALPPAVAENTAGHVRRHVPVDTGGLADSVSVSHNVVNIGARYASYVEFGTRPHRPPIARIAPWALRHGFMPGALFNVIARYGTQPQPYVQDSIDAMLKDFEDIVLKVWVTSVGGILR